MTRQLPDDADTPEQEAERIRRATEAAMLATVAALRRCVFVPGSPDKRFARQIHDQLAGSARPITDRQAQHVLRLAWRYRRQMPSHLVPDTNPDDPLSAARQMPWPGRAPSKSEMLHG